MWETAPGNGLGVTLCLGGDEGYLVVLVCSGFLWPTSGCAPISITLLISSVSSSDGDSGRYGDLVTSLGGESGLTGWPLLGGFHGLLPGEDGGLWGLFG